MAVAARILSNKIIAAFSQAWQRMENNGTIPTKKVHRGVVVRIKVDVRLIKLLIRN